MREIALHDSQGPRLGRLTIETLNGNRTMENVLVDTGQTPDVILRIDDLATFLDWAGECATERLYGYGGPTPCHVFEAVIEGLPGPDGPQLVRVFGIEDPEAPAMSIGWPVLKYRYDMILNPPTGPMLLRRP